MSKIIELNNVIKLYQRGNEKVHALDGISLSIEEGELVAVVGPSGSGKTTFLNMIGCVDKPTSGSVHLNGQETTDFKDKELTHIRSKTIGFIFQQFFLLPTLTALENIQLPALFIANRKEKIKERSREVLELVGLANRSNHLPSQLSGGEMQRVAIARALVNDPKILLADEPTGNLDSHNAQIMLELLRKLNRQGITVIIVTHNLELAKSAQRILSLKDGKITTQVSFS
jgi:putative ABC transport system ATP-binding protein